MKEPEKNQPSRLQSSNTILLEDISEIPSARRSNTMIGKLKGFGSAYKVTAI